MFVPRRLREHYKYQDNKWKPKKQFETLEEAEEESIKASKLAYKCRICKKYHIGRLPKGVKR